MIISISGTPGTGKTRLAKKLAKDLKFKYIDGNKVISLHHLRESHDSKRMCHIIDVNKFSRAVLDMVLGNSIVDSHLSHHLKKAGLCIVCRSELAKLKKRLEKRGYPPSKVRENLDAEIFEVCLSEAIELGQTVIIHKGDYAKTLKKVRAYCSGIRRNAS